MDIYQQTFCLGRGQFINNIFHLGRGRLSTKNVACGGDVYEQKLLLGYGTFMKKNVAWGGDVYEENVCLGRGRL